MTAATSGVSVWEVISDINQFGAGINSGIREKIAEFATMLKSWQIMMPNQSAYELASHIAGACGLLTELYADRTPEGISHYENVQELLNGIKEFSDNGAVPLEAPSAEQDLTGLRTLDLYLQDIALLTDADNDKDQDNNKVMLMTIHSSKGLEFKNVYIVGLEENLFPSQMAMQSRNELEEERRLFYVAITRAESKLTLSYSASRYRWGNLVMCEPSRFLDEIDQTCLDIAAPKEAKHYEDDDTRGSWGGGNPFGGSNRYSGGSQSGYRKPATGSNSSKPSSGSSYGKNGPAKIVPKPANNPAPAGFKKVGQAQPKPFTPAADFKADDPSLIVVGMQVEHQRFGNGKVISIEGRFPDNKAIILFDNDGQKQLLLKFAKLKIVN
jgi:DNA helicase-2/ATP-dependent DNA helicase PcrA